MGIKRIKSIHLGDLHLGHNLNPTKMLVDNLNIIFEDTKRLIELDFIYLNGDIFHRLLPSNSEDYIESLDWLTRVLYICSKYSIRLRILHGTISHDRNQCSILDNIISRLKIEVDYMYITDIYIEKNKEYGINILYVPDNYGDCADDAKFRVKEILHENDLEEVDFIMMHGNFPYQIRGYTSKHAHDADYYSSIVKYALIINHVHKSSIMGKIIAPGSYDRLAHGEEEDKGYIYSELAETGFEYIFIANKNAMPFITYTVEDDDLVKIQKDIAKIYNKYNRYMNIRLHYKTNYTGYTGHALGLSKKFIDIRFTDKKDKDEVRHEQDKEDISTPKTVLNITQDNIVKLLNDKIDWSRLDKHIVKNVRHIIDSVV